MGWFTNSHPQELQLNSKNNRRKENPNDNQLHAFIETQFPKFQKITQNIDIKWLIILLNTNFDPVKGDCSVRKKRTIRTISLVNMEGKGNPPSYKK